MNKNKNVVGKLMAGAFAFGMALVSFAKPASADEWQKFNDNYNDHVKKQTRIITAPVRWYWNAIVSLVEKVDGHDRSHLRWR